MTFLLFAVRLEDRDSIKVKTPTGSTCADHQDPLLLWGLNIMELWHFGFLGNSGL